MCVFYWKKIELFAYICTVQIYYNKMEAQATKTKMILKGKVKKRIIKPTIEMEEDIFVPASITGKKRIEKVINNAKKAIKMAYQKKRRVVSNIHNSIDDSSVVSDLTTDDVNNGNKLYNNLVCEEEDDDDDDITISTTITKDPDVPETLTERITPEYPAQFNEIPDSIDKELLQLQVTAFNANYRITLRANRIYPNQSSIAEKVSNTFNDKKKVIQLIISKTQTGKTGCMIEVINKYINSNNIPIEHIFIITGLSSNDWKQQTAERVPDKLKDQIFHLNDLQTSFKNSVKDKKNILVIIDEVQCACLKEQTISKIMSKNGLNWNIEKMFQDDIKIVQFSATPDGIIFGLFKKEWRDEWYSLHIMEQGTNYYGSVEMMRRGKIKQNKDLCGRDKYGEWKTRKLSEDQIESLECETYENITEMLNDIDKCRRPVYNIIRAHGTTIQWIKENIENCIKMRRDKGIIDNFDIQNIHEYTMDGEIKQINELLSIVPLLNTFILVKEKLKCSHTIKKTHIGIVYERFTKNFIDSFIIQGLLGRVTGNDGVHNIICYTNLKSVENYHKLFNEKFSKEALSKIEWNSNSTKVKQNKTVSKNTYIDMKNSIAKIHGIPIRCQFGTEEAHSVFTSFFKELSKTSKLQKQQICLDFIADIKNGLITVTTHKDSLLYDEKTPDNSKLNIIKLLETRELKNLRKYTLDDAHPESRRFKNFNKAYSSGAKSTGQSGTNTEFSIDMCIDDYNYNGFENPKLVAWVTYNDK